MSRTIRNVNTVLTAVTLISFVAAQADAFQTPRGLIVESVNANSPATKMGLSAGDRIVSYDDKQITSYEVLLAGQQNTFGKKEIVMRVIRGEKTLMLQAPPGALGARVRPELAPATLKLYEEGLTALQEKRTSEAIGKWEAATKSAEETPEKAVIGWLHRRIGAIYERQQEWTKAEAEFAAAWKLLEDGDDPATRSFTASEMGRCRQRLNDFTEAERWYKRAQEINLAAGYDWWVALDLVNLGGVALARGDRAAAQGLQIRAVETLTRLASKSRDSAGVIDTLMNRFLAAVDQLPPGSLDVAALLNRPLIVGKQSTELQTQEFFRHAAAFFELLVRDSEGTSEQLTPHSLDSVAVLAHQGLKATTRGDIDGAHKYLTQAIEILDRLAPNTSLQATGLLALGAIANAHGDIDAAVTYINRGRSILQQILPDSLWAAVALSASGDLALKKNRFPEAQSLFTRAINIIEGHRSSILSPEVRALLFAGMDPYGGLLRLDLKLNDWSSAFADLERARARSLVDLLLERGLDFRADAPVMLLTQQGQLDERRSAAYVALANAHAKLSGVRIELERSEPKRNLEQTDNTKRQIADLEEQIKELAQDLTEYTVQQRELEIEFRRASPKVADLRYPEPLDLDAARRALDPGTLLLAYYVDEDETYLFAVTKTDLEVHRLSLTRSELKKLVAQFQDSVAVERLGDRLRRANENGEILYRALVQPAQEMVNSAKRVLICPDGALQTLPFSALVSQTKPSPRYFGEYKPIHTIVSMTVYAEIRRQAVDSIKRRKTVLLFGDPVYTDEQVTGFDSLRHSTLQDQKDDTQEFESRSSIAYVQRQGLKLDERLPYSRKEVEEIAKLFGRSAILRAGQRATEAAARQESQRADILHFAVHGWLDDQIGLNSGLALSQPALLGKALTKDDNGLLQAWEIFEHIRLKADLVVLSACETGLGQNLQGEGLIGLTRAFQYAGARSIVVSLWNVNDASTAAFMKVFYQELRKGTSKDVALQKAMAGLRSNPKWRHPFYWAPFVLVGDWK